MNKELFYISLFNNKHIGDDAAVVDGRVYSADAFCENIHFKREWMSLERIAAKAVAVNVSDAVAMHATPRYALVSIAIPKAFTPAQMEELAKGFGSACEEYGCEIIGGDTVASDRLDISIALVSATKRPIYRKPLRERYLLAYTGDLGSVAKDLRRLLRGGRISPRSKFVSPKLREGFMRRAARHIKAAMDISDGLFDDLAKMTRLNRKGVRFLSPIPKAKGCSGEEYELLFAFDPRHKRSILARARAARTPVTIFGQVERGRFRNICKPNHF